MAEHPALDPNTVAGQGPSSNTPQRLLERLLDDQRQRWQRHEGLLVEAYLARHSVQSLPVGPVRIPAPESSARGEISDTLPI